MAIVDRINEMAVNLGGDPTGGTIEDALNNLKKVSGGSGNSNEIIVGYDSSDKLPFCNKSLRELMDMITSDDGRTIDVEKVSSISAKIIVTASRPSQDSDRPEYYTLLTYPAIMCLFRQNDEYDPRILDEYNSIKDSINIDDYLYEDSLLPDNFRVIFEFAGIGTEFKYFFGYKDPDADDFDHIIHLFRQKESR